MGSFNDNYVSRYYGLDDEGDYDQYEEDETPVDRPVEYPKDLPVKLAELKKWALASQGQPLGFDTSAYVRWLPDGSTRYDLAGHAIRTWGDHEPVWEYGRDRVTEVVRKPSPGISQPGIRIPVPVAAQAVLGLEDAEAELLFFGVTVAGNEDADLSIAFLDHLLERSVSGQLHMTAEEVEAFMRRWSAEQGIQDPEATWQEGQVSPRAFAA